MHKSVIELVKTREHLWIKYGLFSRQIRENRYVHNNILLLTTNLLAGALAYALHPLLGRMLGIQEYGQVATFVSLALVLFTLTQSMSLIAAKYASSLPVPERVCALPGFIRRTTLVLLTLGGVTTLVFALASGTLATFFHLDAPQEVLLLSLLFLVSFASPLNQGILQGLQRFHWYSVLTLLSALLRLLCAVGLVALGFGINGAILGIVLSAVCTYLLSFWPLRRFLCSSQRPRERLRFRCAASFMTMIITTGVVSLGIVALYSIDTILARHFLNAVEAGLYAALATIGRTILFLTNGVAIILFPRVVTLYERREPHTRVVVQAVCGVLALAMLASTLITRLLFGQAFLSIAGFLPLYGLAMLLLAFSQTLAMYFLAIGNRLFALLILLACGLQMILLSWHHTQISQLVQGVLITNGVLALALLLLWLFQSQNCKPAKHPARRDDRYEEDETHIYG